MLKEKIFYRDELPVNVITANIEEYPIHFHDDIELIFVIEGSVILRNGYYINTLHQGDMFAINDREMHSLERTDEDNMVMMIQMDLTYFCRYYENLKNSFFVTDNDEEHDESTDALKSILARIMMEVIQKGYGYEDKVIESAHNLIGILMSDFQYFVMDDGRFKNEKKKKENKILSGRLTRITDYMYDNYNRKLTLGEIAEREHLSIYYLSHIIKEATGLSFQDLLSYIRVEESEHLLLGTDKRIGAIAEETGFSAVRYYIKHFENWFGMHPLEYRKKYINKIFTREIDAKYTLSKPTDIEAAIKRQAKEVYVDYMDKKNVKPTLVDIDINDDQAEVIKETPALEEIMDRPANAVLAGLYMRLISMSENIIASGNNYIVTTPSKFPGPMDSMTALFYNFDEKVGDSLKEITEQEELLQIVRRYDREAEFLLRSNGLNGEYRILRCRMDSDNIEKRIEKAIDPSRRFDARQALLDEIAVEPSVSTEYLTCSGSATIRSKTKGMGAELILIDRK